MMFVDADDDFTWSGLWHAMRYHNWKWGWDDRKPLPSFGSAIYLYYDGPHYAMRIWRFYVCID